MLFCKAADFLKPSVQTSVVFKRSKNACTSNLFRFVCYNASVPSVHRRTFKRAQYQTQCHLQWYTNHNRQSLSALKCQHACQKLKQLVMSMVEMTQDACTKVQQVIYGTTHHAKPHCTLLSTKTASELHWLLACFEVAQHDRVSKRHS